MIPVRDGEVCVTATTTWASLEAVRTPTGSEAWAVSLTETRHSEEDQGRQAEEGYPETLQGTWLVSAFLLPPGSPILKCSVAAWAPVLLSRRR